MVTAPTVESGRTTAQPGSRTPSFLLGGLILTALFAGLINLVPTSTGPLPSTSLMICAWVLMLAGTVARVQINHGRVPFPPWAVAGTALTVVYFGLFFASAEPLAAMIKSWVYLVGFGTIAYYALLIVRDRQQIDRLVTLAMRGGVALAVFGVIQSVAKSRLPMELLQPRDAEVSSYLGTDVGRSNGLVGNTIVFGALLTLIFALHIARFTAQPTVTNFVTAAAVFAGVVSTYSRVAIVATFAVFVIVVLVVLARRSLVEFIVLGLLVSGLAGALAWIFWPTIERVVSQSFIYSGLFAGGNASVQASDRGHAEALLLGREAFAERPVIGVGIATQREGSAWSTQHGVITDGALWARLAEGGLVLVVPFAILYIMAGLTAWKALQRDTGDWLAAGLLAFMVFEFAGAAVVNSAFFGKSPFVLFWVMFGLLAARHRLTEEHGSALRHSRRSTKQRRIVLGGRLE